ncbi:MAG: invasion associated locus B family protein [Bauldia sp.]
MLHLRFERATQVLRTAALAAVLLPSAAMAQSEPAAPPAAPQEETRWIKICGPDPAAKKQLCQVVQELRAETGQFIASVMIRTLEGEPKIQFVAAVPPGMLLQPGLRAQIDTGKQSEVRYSICFPNSCFAEMDIDDAFIQSMKSGGQLTITTLNKDAKPIAFPLTLAGFTKAYDGEGIDPATAKAKFDDLSKSLKAHADEARQKLIEQQQKGTGTAN